MSLASPRLICILLLAATLLLLAATLGTTSGSWVNSWVVALQSSSGGSQVNH